MWRKSMGSREEQALQAKVSELQAELERLQRQLGELHTTDVSALRRAYASLSQHVTSLELESRGLVQDLEGFETEPIAPDNVADELGVAASLAVGISLLNRTVINQIPALRLLGKGLWLAGGAYVIFRLTGGTLGRVLGAFRRNNDRKRHLRHRLETVQDRVHVMVALQRWAEKQAAPAEAEGGGASATSGTPPPGEHKERVSPTTSASSAELVDMPTMASPLREGVKDPGPDF